MDGVEVSAMRWSSTLVNVSPCTYPSYMRNSLVCFKADVFVATSINVLIIVLLRAHGPQWAESWCAQ